MDPVWAHLGPLESQFGLTSPGQFDRTGAVKTNLWAKMPRRHARRSRFDAQGRVGRPLRGPADRLRQPKTGASVFITVPHGIMDFQGSKLRPPTRNWARRPSETGFRVKRNNFLVQGQKEGNWFRLILLTLLTLLILLILLILLMLLMLLMLLILLILLILLLLLALLTLLIIPLILLTPLIPVVLLAL